jgi:hypothetical protein
MRSQQAAGAPLRLRAARVLPSLAWALALAAPALPAQSAHAVAALGAGAAGRTTPGAEGGVEVRGRVTDTAGGPVAGVHVTVTAEPGGSAEVRTARPGTYRLVLPGAPRTVVISVSGPGWRPATQVVSVPVGAAVVVKDFALTAQPVVLSAVRAVASRRLATAPRRTPGTTQGGPDDMQLRQQELRPGDLAGLAGDETGVARAGGDGGGISIAGQAPDQTRVTLDGATLEGGVVPREAIAGVQVVTNTYDVARGQFAGGHVAVATQRGGERWGGSFRASGAAPWTQWGGVSGGVGRAGQLALDAGGGGAPVPGRLFAYGALTLRHAELGAARLGGLDSLALSSLGATPAEVDRFQSTARSLGISTAAPRGDGSTSAAGLLRLDAVLRPNATLTLRLEGQAASAHADADPLVLTGGTDQRRGQGGAMAQLTTGGVRAGNVLRLYGAASGRRSRAVRPGVGGLVGLGAGEGSPASLRFGGEPSDGSSARQRTFEASDEAALVTADGAHRLRLGAEYSLRGLRQDFRGDAGTFAFQSLADLEAGRPAAYWRAFGDRGQAASAARAALYTADHWKLGGVQLTYGVRVERAWYPSRAAASAALRSLFGTSAGRVPSTVRVSPRAGVSFEVRMPWERGTTSSTSVQAGFGEFVGSLPAGELTAALAETGLPGQAELLCAGDAVPAASWAALRGDPAAAPTRCALDASSFASRVGRATLFAPGFTLPRARRASVNLVGMLPGLYTWRGWATLVRGSGQPVAFDRNLRAAPAFTLPGEAGRPVYVPAAAVDAATGMPSLLASRLHPELGVVRQVDGRGRSRTVQLAGELGHVSRLGTYQLGYTWTRSRQQRSPLDAPGGLPGTALDDPGALAWADAGYTPQHLLQATWRVRVPRQPVSFTARGRLASGLPFTPGVDGDVNGDATRNDPAFVFDPAQAGDAAVSAGMRALLRDAPGGVRACLRAQLGRVAAPGSCRGAWNPALDLTAQLALRKPRGMGGNRATLWLSASNVTAGLDYLLHGPGGLRGWGQFGSPDATLLRVRGFDPAARAYRYEVNPRFGRAAAGGFRVPFSLSVQARIVVGKDPAWHNVLAELGTPGTELTLSAVRAHLDAQGLDVAGQVVALNGPHRLSLLPAQVERLQQVSDSLARTLAGVTDSLVSLVSAPAGTALPERQARIVALTARARLLMDRGQAAARQVLTPQQWSRLPAALTRGSADFTPFPPRDFAVPPES